MKYKRSEKGEGESYMEELYLTMAQAPNSRRNPTMNHPYRGTNMVEKKSLEMGIPGDVEAAAIRQSTWMVRMHRAIGRQEAAERNQRRQASRTNVKCYLCEGNHLVNDCDTDMDVEERRRRVKQMESCTVCLRPNALHFAIQCPALKVRRPVGIYKKLREICHLRSEQTSSVKS